MSEIQVDVYDVQLGASVLLQFKIGEETVRVLADAGLFKASRPLEYVRDELKKQFPDENPIRIDLLIGTHYDADHLCGLVPIIEDKRFDIGEAWMPPVANDTLKKELDELPSQDDLLAHQFYSSNGEDDLRAYFIKKHDDLIHLKALMSEKKDESLTFKAHVSNVSNESGFSYNHYRVTDNENYFHLAKIYNRDDKVVERDRDLFVSKFQDSNEKENALKFDEMHFFIQIKNQDNPPSHAEIKETINAKASDAITASNLYKVVKALACRQIPLKTEIIENGTPRRYVWDALKKRFIQNNIPSNGLELKLLGPSKEQVKNQWHKLPIEEQLSKTFSKRFKTVRTTPSNQLSYIMRFETQKQGILISGDSGCDGFYNKKEDSYYPKLLAALLPLHLIQVAHHGGANSQFYNVLLEANYPSQKDASFLLLSHETNDKKRPSIQFKEFLLEAIHHEDDIRVVFTAKPLEEKIADYKQYIHKNVGVISEAGTARLVFEKNKWDVSLHAISFD